MDTDSKAVRTVGLSLIAAVSGTAAAVAWEPALISFAVAVTAAIGWCIWLERHP
jgi:hypothetical protein